MLIIDPHGMVVSRRIKSTRRPIIEHRPMTVIHGIIVHQTGGTTAQSALDSYQRASAMGAHFLIDRDGTIFQTASLHKQTWHVGKLKARCLMEKRCTPAEAASLRHFNPSGESAREMRKSVPDRFPSNLDSIGIELVGAALPKGSAVPDDKKIYQAVTSEQNASLRWLVGELLRTLNVPTHEVFRHPDVSRKNPTEASTAQW